MTFGDLMSLLLTFFILLLSFSRMDLESYEALAGHMRMAFGLQPIHAVAGIVEIDATLIQDHIRNIDAISTPYSQARTAPVDGEQEDQDKTIDTVDQKNSEQDAARSADQTTDWADRETAEQYEMLIENLRNALIDEMAVAEIVVERREGEVMIRFPENFAFSSGSDELKDGFRRSLNNIAPILETIEGKVIVAGHTDDIPIATARFPSNWRLASSRAESVITYLADTTMVANDNFAIHSFADTVPLAPNDSPENRALNRRVEIVIRDVGPN